MIVPEFTTYLQTFPGSVPFFPSYWPSEAKTHKALRQVSVPSYNPFCKIHTPFTSLYFIKKTLLKNISSATVVVFTNMCVFRYSILASFDPQKCNLVI
jgi:hypothetical protein